VLFGIDAGQLGQQNSGPERLRGSLNRTPPQGAPAKNNRRLAW